MKILTEILAHFVVSAFPECQLKNVETAAAAFFVQSCVVTKFPWGLYMITSSIGVDSVHTKNAAAAVSPFFE